MTGSMRSSGLGSQAGCVCGKTHLSTYQFSFSSILLAQKRYDIFITKEQTMVETHLRDRTCPIWLMLIEIQLFQAHGSLSAN